MEVVHGLNGVQTGLYDFVDCASEIELAVDFNRVVNLEILCKQLESLGSSGGLQEQN